MRTAPPEGAAREREAEESDPLEAFAREVGPALERLGAEIEKLFGGSQPAGTEARGHGGTEEPTSRSQASAPKEGLLARRDRLDSELRHGLESLGIVVRAQDVARAVGVAVGKRIEWTG